MTTTLQSTNSDRTLTVNAGLYLDDRGPRLGLTIQKPGEDRQVIYVKAEELAAAVAKETGVATVLLGDLPPEPTLDRTVYSTGERLYAFEGRGTLFAVPQDMTPERAEEAAKRFLAIARMLRREAEEKAAAEHAEKVEKLALLMPSFVSPTDSERIARALVAQGVEA